MARAIGKMQRQANGNVKRQPPSYVCSECYRVRRKQAEVDALVEGVLVGRLQMPDAAQLFAQGDPAALEEAHRTIAAINARLENTADMFARRTIEAPQLERITELLLAERALAITAVEAALPAAIPAELMSSAAAEVWSTLSMDTKRTILKALVTVTIMPSGSGKAFDPATVLITWHS